MKLSLLPLDLARWDEAPHDALLLPIFSDERPLRGAAGLADWRLCGRLTRLLKRSRLSGARGETLLLPPGRRLTFARIMLFGAFAVLAGGLSIVVNAPSIYAGSVVRSERYAIRERVGAWRLILANTILTTLSWIGYCAFAVYFLVEEM